MRSILLLLYLNILWNYNNCVINVSSLGLERIGNQDGAVLRVYREYAIILKEIKYEICDIYWSNKGVYVELTQYKEEILNIVVVYSYNKEW